MIAKNLTDYQVGFLRYVKVARPLVGYPNPNIRRDVARKLKAAGLIDHPPLDRGFGVEWALTSEGIAALKEFS